MRKWLREHVRDFDVVNTHSSTDAWLVAMAGAIVPSMPPVVRTRHVSTPVNNSWTTRWLYQRATRHIVVTGEALKAQLVRDNGFDPRASRRCAPASTLRAFRPLDRAAARAQCGVDARPAVAIVRDAAATGRATTIFSTRGPRCTSRGGSSSSSATGRGATTSSGG
jgi:hypothetical protein